MGKGQEEKNKKNHLPWQLRLYTPRAKPPDEQNKAISAQIKDVVEEYKEFGPEPLCQGELQNITDRFEVGNFNAVDLSPPYDRLMALVAAKKEEVIHSIATYLPDGPRPIILAIKVIKTIQQVRKNIECALELVQKINDLITYYNAKLAEAQQAILDSIDNIKTLKDNIRNLNVEAMIKKFGADVAEELVYKAIDLSGAIPLLEAAVICAQTADEFKESAETLLNKEFKTLKDKRDKWHAEPADKGPTGGTSFVGSVNAGPKSMWGPDEHVDMAFKYMPKSAQKEFRQIKGLEKSHRTMAQQFENAGKTVKELEEAEASIPKKFKAMFQAEPNIALLPDNLEQLSDEILNLVLNLPNPDCANDQYSKLCQDNFFQFGVVAIEEVTKPLIKVVFPKPYDEIPERITATLKLPDDYELDDTNFDDNPPDPQPIIEQLGTLPSVTTLRHTKEHFWVYVGKRAFSFSAPIDPNPTDPNHKFSNKNGYYTLNENGEYEFMGTHDIKWNIQWQAVGIKEFSSEESIAAFEEKFEEFEERMENGVAGTPSGLSAEILDTDDDEITTDPPTGGPEDGKLPTIITKNRVNFTEVPGNNVWVEIASGSDTMQLVNFNYDTIRESTNTYVIRFTRGDGESVEIPMGALMSVNVSNLGGGSTTASSGMVVLAPIIKSSNGPWKLEVTAPGATNFQPGTTSYINAFIAHYT